MEGPNAAPADAESCNHSFLNESDPNALYTLVELLGEGSYGCVYKGVNTETEEEVAVKILPYESADDVESLKSEINALKRLSSPFVVSYIDSYKIENEMWIIMEYCGGGSMSDILSMSADHLLEQHLQAVMAYCVLGLQHVHSLLGIHRDIKAGNVLLTIDGRAKLADFGVSVQLTNSAQKRKTLTGTPYWIAPEVVQEISYDSKADIWSLGVTVLELCEGRPPHFEVHPMRAIFMISMKPAPRLKEPSKWSADMNRFIERCLVKAPDLRASASDLVVDPWISAAVVLASHGGGIQCLQELVASNWSKIIASRVVRRRSVIDIELDVVAGKRANQQLRGKVNMISKAQAISQADATFSVSKSASRRTSHSVFRTPDDVSQPADRESTLLQASRQASKRFSDTTLVMRSGESSNVGTFGTFFAYNKTEVSSSRFESPVRPGGSLLFPNNMNTSTLEETLMFNDIIIRAENDMEKFDAQSSGIDITDIDLIEMISDFSDRKVYKGADPNGIYSRDHILGKGSYGFVYRARNLVTNETVAIKVLPCPNIKDIGTEVDFLRRLDSRFIVSFSQGFMHNRELWIVMEYCEGGSISDFMRFSKRTLCEPEVVGVTAYCLLGLVYLHSLLGIHRDIKGANILLTNDGHVKLADFGVSAQLTQTLQQRNTLIGTPYWMAPEVIEESDYDTKADVWGLGITIIEMMEGRPPHYEVHPMRAVFIIPQSDPPTLKSSGTVSSAMNQFIAKCLVKVSSRRCSSTSLLEHEWVKKTVNLISEARRVASLVALASQSSVGKSLPAAQA